MKALFLAVCFVLAVATMAQANPFLTADDMIGVDSYIVELDGVEQPESPAVSNHLWFDMAGITSGSHTVRAKGKNIWGVGPYSDPFVFEKALPGKPSGLGLRAR
jgi:hypothetical protein